MFTKLLASGALSIQWGEYTPLLVVIGVLAVLFVLFKLLGVTAKVLWKLLINGIIGMGMLCLFDIIFVSYLHMDFFYIPINWINAIIAGVLGIPGVLLLLILRVIL